MATHTFSTVRYGDNDQTLADSLFQFKQNKTYAVERMGIEGLNPNDNVIGEFFVVAEVETRYRKKKTDQWASLNDFWTFDRIFAKNCPHWERTAVTVSVGMGIRDDIIDNKDHNPIIQKLVSFHTHFDSKYKCHADGIATKLVTNNYDETCEYVSADWNDNCIKDGEVERTPLTNGVGILLALSKHIKQQRSEHNKKVLDIFSKVKV